MTFDEKMKALKDANESIDKIETMIKKLHTNASFSLEVHFDDKNLRLALLAHYSMEKTGVIKEAEQLLK